MFGLEEYFRPTYARVSDEENEQDNEQVPPEIELQHSGRRDEKNCPTCARQMRRRVARQTFSSDSWWPWIAHAVLFSTSAILFGLSLSYSSSACDSRWEGTRVFSPANEAVDYRITVFNGSFEFPSIYRGFPTQDIDDAWNRVSRDVGFIRVSESDLEKMGYGNTSRSYMARYREEDGGGYLATIEVFHQLHCLNLLRKVTYREFYEKIDPSFQKPADFFRTHLDHCIELLRQVLMCSADVAIITYDWVEGHDDPYPDFNTEHQCKDFERVLRWGRERLVNAPLSRLGRLGDEINLKEVPRGYRDVHHHD